MSSQESMLEGDISEAPARNHKEKQSSVVLFMEGLPHALQQRIQKVTLALLCASWLGGMALNEYRPSKELDIPSLLSKNIIDLTPEEMDRLLECYSITLADLELMLNVHEYDAVKPITLRERLKQQRIETFAELAQTEPFRARHVWIKDPAPMTPDEHIPKAIQVITRIEKFPNGHERLVVVQLLATGNEIWLDPETGARIAQPIFD